MTPFSLVDAHSAREAVALLGMHGPGAQPIAFGGDLLGLLKEGVFDAHHASPRVLVNLATAPDLACVDSSDGGFRLGAMLTLAQLRRELQLPPMLHEAIDHIASPQLRARTTLGGNLLQRPRCLYFRNPHIDCFKKAGTNCPGAAAPPAAYPGALFPGICHAGHPSDLAPVLIALHAQVEIASWEGVRRRPLNDLYGQAAFNRAGEAQLAQDELLTAIVVPRWSSAQAFEKIAARVANEFSQAAAAAIVEADDGLIGSARIVLSGIAPGPFRFDRAHELLVGRRATEIDPAHVARELMTVSSATLPIAAGVQAARLAIERALTRALARMEF